MKIVKTVIVIFVAALLVIGGVLLIKKRKEADKNTHTALIYPVIVKNYKSEYKRVKLTFPYMAVVKNDKEVLVSSKFSGRILEIKELGDRVSKGEVVAVIDGENLKSKLKEIESKIKSLKERINAQKMTLKNLKATHARTKALLEVKMASVEEYQNEESKIASIRASLKADENSLKALIESRKSALNDLSYTTLKSPVTGIISAKFLNKNDNAFIGKPLLKITPKGGNYLSLTLSKNAKSILYKGKEYPLIPLKTTINSLKAFKAEIEDKSLIAGEKVDVKIVVFDKEGSFLPYETILSTGGEDYVFVVDGKKAKAIPIKLVAKGKEGAVTDKKIDGVLIAAKPDILLKIKAGYPFRIKE